MACTCRLSAAPLPVTASLICEGAYSWRGMPAAPIGRQGDAPGVAQNERRARACGDEHALDHRHVGAMRGDELHEDGLERREALDQRRVAGVAYCPVRDMTHPSPGALEHTKTCHVRSGIDAENSHACLGGGFGRGHRLHLRGSLSAVLGRPGGNRR